MLKGCVNEMNYTGKRFKIMSLKSHPIDGFSRQYKLQCLGAKVN